MHFTWRNLIDCLKTVGAYMTSGDDVPVVGDFVAENYIEVHALVDGHEHITWGWTYTPCQES